MIDTAASPLSTRQAPQPRVGSPEGYARPVSQPSGNPLSNSAATTSSPLRSDKPGGGASSPGTLTRRQSEALAFIKAEIAAKGYGPSFAEIGKALHLKSKSSVSRLVHGLVDRGAVEHRSERARDYRILGDGDARVHLKALLDLVSANHFLWREESAVVAAKRFMGMPA